MDPKQTLIDAAAHLRTHGERIECAYLLAEYFTWRIKGGFNPVLSFSVSGDDEYVILLAKLGNAADTLSEAI